MGNCLETWIHSSQEEGDHERNQPHEGEGEGAVLAEELEGEQKGVFGKAESIKIKILLTKEELEWLLLQLQEKGGRNRLEDVLVGIEKGRGRNNDGWKPSLESIMESPEVQTVEKS